MCPETVIVDCCSTKAAKRAPLVDTHTLQRRSDTRCVDLLCAAIALLNSNCLPDCSSTPLNAARHVPATIDKCQSRGCSAIRLVVLSTSCLLHLVFPQMPESAALQPVHGLRPTNSVCEIFSIGVWPATVWTTLPHRRNASASCRGDKLKCRRCGLIAQRLFTPAVALAGNPHAPDTVRRGE